MPASEAQIKANKANSLKSTGPSELGKLQSRKNAVKHGFCATVVDVEDPEAVRARTEEIAMAPPGAPTFEGWAAGQMATMSVKIERCQAREQAVRERISNRAQVTWDDDRKLEAILLAATISKRPEAVSARLGETLQGCIWMLTRWSMLACAADSQGSWTPAQTQLAFDLLGTPHEFREAAPPGTEINVEGRVIDQPQDQAVFARQQIAILVERSEQLRPLDEAARLRAEAGLADETDPELVRLRRYEASLQRRLEWSYNLLCKLSQPPSGDQTLKPEPARPPEIETGVPSKSVHVQGPKAPAPSRKRSRAERRMIEAESRRGIRKRKHQELLA
jgi:hypothetical protein